MPQLFSLPLSFPRFSFEDVKRWVGCCPSPDAVGPASKPSVSISLPRVTEGDGGTLRPDVGVKRWIGCLRISLNPATPPPPPPDAAGQAPNPSVSISLPRVTAGDGGTMRPDIGIKRWFAGWLAGGSARSAARSGSRPGWWAGRALCDLTPFRSFRSCALCDLTPFRDPFRALCDLTPFRDPFRALCDLTPFRVRSSCALCDLTPLCALFRSGSRPGWWAGRALCDLTPFRVLRGWLVRSLCALCDLTPFCAHQLAECDGGRRRHDAP